jgi:hypothetical protein
LPLIVAALLGFLLVVFLIVHSGAAEVASAMLALGWWLAPITLYHLVTVYFDATSWRELFPASGRPGRLGFLWMRWIRESVSTLLPVAGRHHGRHSDPARLCHRGSGAARRWEVPRREHGRLGSHDRGRRVRGGDRHIRPDPTRRHVWKIGRLGSPTGSKELDVWVHRPSRSN